MNTLAQFKKDIKVGTYIELVSMRETHISISPDVLRDKPIHERIQGVRLVSRVNATGFYLKNPLDESNLKGSKCDYPKATDFTYTGDTFVIVERSHSDNNKIWQERVYKIIR